MPLPLLLLSLSPLISAASVSVALFASSLKVVMFRLTILHHRTQPQYASSFIKNEMFTNLSVCLAGYSISFLSPSLLYRDLFLLFFSFEFQVCTQRVPPWPDISPTNTQSLAPAISRGELLFGGFLLRWFSLSIFRKKDFGAASVDEEDGCFCNLSFQAKTFPSKQANVTERMKRKPERETSKTSWRYGGEI